MEGIKRICTNCGKLKHLSEFYKLNGGKYGKMSICKTCDNKRKQEYGRTKDGIITQIYSDQISTSKQRNYPSPTYTKQELKDWMFSQKIFHELFDNWKNSEYNTYMKPSCDRIDDYDSYSLDNIQLITWMDNKLKAYNDKRNGINNKNSKAVISINIITGEETNYYSARQASRETGVNQGNLSSCCRGEKNIAGGFYWKFTE